MPNFVRSDIDSPLIDFFCGVSANIYQFEHGAGFPGHSDPYDVVIVCLYGYKSVSVEGVTHFLDAGEYLVVERGLSHTTRNDGYCLSMTIRLPEFPVQGCRYPKQGQLAKVLNGDYDG